MVKHFCKQHLEKFLLWTDYVWKQVRTNISAHLACVFITRFVPVLVPGLFLSVVSFVPHIYYLVDSRSPISASSMDGCLLVCVLVLALQVGTAWFKAWGMAGLWTPQEDALHGEMMVGVLLSDWPRVLEGQGHQLCHSVQKKLLWARLVGTGSEHPCVSANMAKSPFFSGWGEQFSIDVEQVSRQCWAIPSPSKMKDPNSQTAAHSPGVPYQLQGHLVDYF